MALGGPAHLDLHAGYRYAKATDYEVHAVTEAPSFKSGQDLDWSGIITRAGIELYFGKE